MRVERFIQRFLKGKYHGLYLENIVMICNRIQIRFLLTVFCKQKLNAVDKKVRQQYSTLVDYFCLRYYNIIRRTAIINNLRSFFLEI